MLLSFLPQAWRGLLMGLLPRRARSAGAAAFAEAAPGLVRPAAGLVTAVAAAAATPRWARPAGGLAAPRPATSAEMHAAAVAAVAAEPQWARPAGRRVSKAKGQGPMASGEKTGEH